MDGQTFPSLRFLSLMMMASAVYFSVTASAQTQTVRIRTAAIDRYKVAVASDQSLFGIDCERGNLVFATDTGIIAMDEYALKDSVSNRAPVRSKSIAIESGALDELCTSPLGTEYQLVISKDLVGIIQEFKQGMFRMADTSTARAYRVGRIPVAVMDRYRLVGFDCKENKVVLQDMDSFLAMGTIRSIRSGRIQSSNRPVTDGSLDWICSAGTDPSGSDLLISGLRSDRVSVIKTPLNARGQ